MTATHCYLLPFLGFFFVSNTASDKTFLTEITFFSKCLLGGEKGTVLIDCKEKPSQPRLSNVAI